MTTPRAKLVGLIPAAGRGTRLGRLPFCKELYPLGYRAAADSPTGSKAIAVSQDLVERLAMAGVARAFIVLGPGKTAIMDYFGDGKEVGMDLAYLMQDTPRGMPFALDLARPWLHDETIVFGMPDTIVRPKASFVQLLAAHDATDADVTLGVFPTAEPHRFGMVALDAQDRVVASVDKPSATALRYMWGIACWGPAFTALMGACLRDVADAASEVVMSTMFQRAIDAGLRVRAVRFETGEYIDIGSPEIVKLGLARYVDDEAP